MYLHFQTPVYQVSASIMIKDDKKNGSGNAADIESLGLGGMITSAQSIDNGKKDYRYTKTGLPW
jgi:hypothetical protein